MTKKFIFIPVVNNFHLLEKAVKSIKPHLYDEYFIFNNSNNIIPEHIYNNTPFKVWNPIRRMTFTETQNIMMNYAIDNNFDYYSFMHNDCEVIDDADIRLIEYANKLVSENNNWGIIFTHYDVLCVFNTNAVKNVGIWGDDKWPFQQSGYYLDVDYYRRIKLHNYEIHQLENCNGVLHTEVSNTIKNIHELRVWESQRKSVENHYLQKWGGMPNHETYNSSFNIKI